MLSSCLLPSPLLCRAAIHCCLAAVLVFDCVERHPSTLLQQMVMPPMVTAFGGGLFVQDMHSRWFAVPETIECENSHASFQFTHLMHFSACRALERYRYRSSTIRRSCTATTFQLVQYGTIIIYNRRIQYCTRCRTIERSRTIEMVPVPHSNGTGTGRVQRSSCTNITIVRYYQTSYI